MIGLEPFSATPCVRSNIILIFALRHQPRCSDLWEFALTHDLSAPPRISDWPASYVEQVIENECNSGYEAVVLERLVRDHRPMRFGKRIDLNVQQGFYFNRGDGQITIGEGTDCGHLIEVLDYVEDGIDITVSGDMSWSAAPFADHYVRNADDKVAWVFTKAKGPWFLTANHHERKGDEFYFLVVHFLSKADDQAFMAAFKEASA